MPTPTADGVPSPDPTTTAPPDRENHPKVAKTTGTGLRAGPTPATTQPWDTSAYRPAPLQGRPLQTELIPNSGRATSDPRPPGAWHLPICLMAVTHTTPSSRKSFASPNPAYPRTL